LAGRFEPNPNYAFPVVPRFAFFSPYNVIASFFCSRRDLFPSRQDVRGRALPLAPSGGFSFTRGCRGLFSFPFVFPLLGSDTPSSYFWTPKRELFWSERSFFSTVRQPGVPPFLSGISRPRASLVCSTRPIFFFSFPNDSPFFSVTRLTVTFFFSPRSARSSSLFRGDLSTAFFFSRRLRRHRYSLFCERDYRFIEDAAGHAGRRRPFFDRATPTVFFLQSISPLFC